MDSAKKVAGEQCILKKGFEMGNNNLLPKQSWLGVLNPPPPPKKNKQTGYWVPTNRITLVASQTDVGEVAHELHLSTREALHGGDSGDSAQRDGQMRVPEILCIFTLMSEVFLIRDPTLTASGREIMFERYIADGTNPGILEKMVAALVKEAH